MRTITTTTHHPRHHNDDANTTAATTATEQATQRNATHALTSSVWLTKSSKRSVTPSLLRCGLASGDMQMGCSQMKAGLPHSGSRKCSVSLSNSRAWLRGGRHSTPNSTHLASRNARHSAPSYLLGCLLGVLLLSMLLL